MPRQNQLIRVSRWLVSSLLFAWVAHLIAANLYLNADGLELTVSTAEDTALVRLGSAFSWWPGRVIAHDLQVIVHDSNVEMDLRIDEVKADIRLLSLFEKELETHSATVTGVSLRLRQTRPLAKLCRQPRGLPPIDGMARPPGRDNPTCTSQIDTAYRRTGPPSPWQELFHIRLNGLVVGELREIWIERYRATGKIDLAGRMSFWPKKEVGFTVSRLHARGANLAMGQRRPINQAEIEARGRMKTLSLTNGKEDDVWRALTFSTKADVKDIDLELVERLISTTVPLAPPKLPHVEGRALLKGELTIVEGWTELLSAHVAAMQASLRLLERELVGRVVLDVRLEPASRSNRVLTIKHAKAELTNIEIRGRAETHHFGDTRVDVTARGAGAVSPLQQRIHIELEGRASKCAPLLELIPGGFKKTLANLLIDDDEPALAKAELFADADVARFESLSIEMDHVHVRGRMRLAPDPGGELVIDYRGIEFKVGI